jgi:hypothetical protein
MKKMSYTLEYSGTENYSDTISKSNKTLSDLGSKSPRIVDSFKELQLAFEKTMKLINTVSPSNALEGRLTINVELKEPMGKVSGKESVGSYGAIDHDIQHLPSGGKIK